MTLRALRSVFCILTTHTPNHHYLYLNQTGQSRILGLYRYNLGRCLNPLHNHSHQHSF